MKKKSISKKFKSAAEMDRSLETSDLSKDFKEKGILKKEYDFSKMKEVKNPYAGKTSSPKKPGFLTRS
jgi:hypothetical protein